MGNNGVFGCRLSPWRRRLGGLQVCPVVAVAGWRGCIVRVLRFIFLKLLVALGLCFSWFFDRREACSFRWAPTVVASMEGVECVFCVPCCFQMVYTIQACLSECLVVLISFPLNEIHTQVCYRKTNFDPQRSASRFRKVTHLLQYEITASPVARGYINTPP